MDKIKADASLDKEKRQKALREVLNKETELLQTIDRLKI